MDLRSRIYVNICGIVKVSAVELNMIYLHFFRVPDLNLIYLLYKDVQMSSFRPGMSPFFGADSMMVPWFCI